MPNFFEFEENQMNAKSAIGSVALVALLVVFASCADDEGESTAPDGLPQAESTVMTPNAKGDGVEDYPESFEEFLNFVYCESDGRVCVVDGDTPITGGWAGLRAFYDEHVDVDRDQQQQGLSVNWGNRGDDLWYGEDRYNLSFCITDDFGDRKDEVVEATLGAVEDWEEIADVKFPYREDQDSRCDLDNRQVLFPILPAEDSASYLARAFFPTPIVSDDEEEDDEDGETAGDEDDGADEEPVRDVRINLAAIDRSWNDISFRGLMRHELGHILGFRHEHTRIDEGYWCFEDNNYRPGTAYDAASVMHYPQCDGTNDWSLEFSEYDKIGAAYFYPPEGVEVMGRCDEEIDGDGNVSEDCEPVVDQILTWLSQYGEQEVLVDWMGMDDELAETVADERMEGPFEDFDDLEERAGMDDEDIRYVYDYLFEWGRCPDAELDDEDWVSPSCYPVVNGILQLANTASFTVLDEDVGLDRRAVENITAARDRRDIDTYDGLVSLGYVKQRALFRMYDHLYDQH